MNRKKILVVDDDEVVLKALTIKLNADDYDVVTAMDGSEAAGAVRQERPDLILLDINFPAEPGSSLSDGFRIMAWLKRLDEAAKIPVIVITGSDPAKYEKEAKAAGAAALIHKSIDHEELFEVIRETLDEAATAMW